MVAEWPRRTAARGTSPTSPARKGRAIRGWLALASNSLAFRTKQSAATHANTVAPQPMRRPAMSALRDDVFARHHATT